MKQREDIIKERLYDLYNSYLKQQNQRIEEENQQIEIKNQQIINYHKSQLQRPEKPILQTKLRKYTAEQFFIDFENKYGISMYRSKFNKYINGTVCPPEKILYCFADFFHVSYDYLIGNNDVKNPSIDRITEFLPLSETAILQLLSFKEYPIVIQVLNALLENEHTKYILMNLYSDCYLLYEMKNTSDSPVPSEYDSLPTLMTISKALALYRYVEDQLTSYLKSDYEKQLQEKLDWQDWCSMHPEALMPPTIPNETDTTTFSSISKEKEKDNQ